MGIRDRLEVIFTPSRLLIVFTAINLLNYVDRGLLPGAPEQIGEFLHNDLHTNATDFDLGLLQSSFICGYAVSSLIFGHLVHYFQPFNLMACGLGIWCCAAVLSGIAPHFWVLLIGRIISGVGEASFQCIVPPFIDDHAPQDKRSLWLAIFFSAIPIGYACGYGLGAVIATSLSWRWAFFFECMLMAPLAALLPFLPSHGHGRRLSVTETPHGHLVALPDEKIHNPSVLEEFKVALFNPLFMCTVLGYAAYTFVTAGFANFGPTFLLGLNMFSSETSASLSFGAIVSLTGFIGTPVGGIMLDKLVVRFGTKPTDDLTEAQREVLDHETKLVCAFGLLTVLSIFGMLFCLICPFTTSPVIFFLGLGIGTLFLFATTAAVNVAVMGSVPAKTRSFAIGLSTIIMHGLGDVPSPTLIGLVADDLGPRCPKGTAMGSPCQVKRSHGLEVTLLLVIMWLLWEIVFWGAGIFVARKRRSTVTAELQAPLLQQEVVKSRA